MSDKLYISWDKLQEDTLVLAEKLAPSISKDTQLVCISRGGLFIGGILSYALGLKDVHCVSLESYTEDADGANEEVISRTPFLPFLYDKWELREKPYLVVDDINDTSQTYKYVLGQFRILNSKGHRANVAMQFATTYHKQREENLKPTFIGKTLPADSWVVFPWDHL